ncbi:MULTISPECIES: response regulator [Mucilaginibacter]|uniref:CheY-like chemotaxis protein n=1 Tax=Mucilaginibacter lappiensis TaxID=354630 RepID=A0A1N6TC09_9SPHI|nr:MULTISPECIES: response regulator [Mucilaginibacter]MBB6108128.1 CheY-like chemotaxis protein [Mucilaginibacter lappiensis]MBB6130274.1 CheY-like chemotaxis protein [Mucilaginibacter lappiensis]NHA06572.1 response regulator [Mucilaginibacter inviolabilis]SDP87441.1 Response regulator receiver domain-containing protein [Mucilaginibacter sp. OK268]SIQ50831.1 Response regulator receiver domain-containing protein [Mucilaginibacter lappiensis]
MTINDKPVSVLLIDDDEINNFISIKLIKKALLNTEIMACLNGKFAIEQLSDIQRKDPAKMPDYILLDINMPIMNGWEFLDEFKRLNIDPQGKSKIYIISSSVFSNDINKAKSYPLVKDFISKPLNVEKIKELFEVGAHN